MEKATPIGDQIKTARKAAGWTQAELAEKAGVLQSAVSEIETSKRRRPSYEVVSKLLAVLPSRQPVAA